jgi:hypothetical protein
MLFIIKFLETNNESALAERLLEELFVALTEANFQQQEPVFPSPYIGIEEFLDVDLDGYRGTKPIPHSRGEEKAIWAKAEPVGDVLRNEPNPCGDT